MGREFENRAHGYCQEQLKELTNDALSIKSRFKEIILVIIRDYFINVLLVSE